MSALTKRKRLRRERAARNVDAVSALGKRALVLEVRNAAARNRDRVGRDGAALDSELANRTGFDLKGDFFRVASGLDERTEAPGLNLSKLHICKVQFAVRHSPIVPNLHITRDSDGTGTNVELPVELREIAVDNKRPFPGLNN